MYLFLAIMLGVNYIHEVGPHVYCGDAVDLLKVLTNCDIREKVYFSGSISPLVADLDQGCILAFLTTLAKFTCCLMYLYHIYMVSAMSCSYSIFNV